MDGLNQDRLRVEKIWGYEDHIANSPLYCGKKLFIEKGKNLSLHFHLLKTEHFYCAAGTALVRYYDDVSLDEDMKSWYHFHNLVNLCSQIKTLVLKTGDSLYIPTGRRHTIKALAEDVEIFEFSTQHFDSDSIRVISGLDEVGLIDQLDYPATDELVMVGQTPQE